MVRSFSRPFAITGRDLWTQDTRRRRALPQRGVRPVHPSEPGRRGATRACLQCLRGALLATIRHELKGEQSEMLDALRDAAIARHGARVDVVINANVFTEDRDVRAASRCTLWSAPQAPSRYPQREGSARELGQLRAAGRITRDKSDQKRRQFSAILSCPAWLVLREAYKPESWAACDAASDLRLHLVHTRRICSPQPVTSSPASAHAAGIGVVSN